MTNLLEVKDLSKEYPNYKLDRVSFNIPKGTIMGLIGENGAGKSTTLSAVLDLIQKDSGTVTFWGKQISDDPINLKEDIGVVFDGINYYETLTPAKVGKISRLAYTQWDEAVYQDYLKNFNLPPNKEIKTFSKGMKVKLCIAVALSHHPKFLILDEATSGLDPIVRDEILDLFLDFVQDEEHSILISSHISSDLERIADYITFIHEGKLILSKPKDELIYNYGILRCGATAFQEIEKEDILAYQKKEYEWNVLVADKEKASKKYRKAVIDNATIDDIMLLYIKGEAV